MSKPGAYVPKDEMIEKEVSAGLNEAQQFARKLDFEEAKSGKWFYSLLQKVVQAYDRNARAEYFRQKYPGLERDEIADMLTSVTVRYAAVAGGITGTAATASQLTTLASAGMTATLFAGAIGSEMVYLSRIQMRLVLDLCVVYDLQLDPEDPEDVLMVLGYALGIAPTNMLGTGALVVAREGTTTVIKRWVSKGTLEAVQRFGARLGIKILQRTIIKYTVPVVSAAVGSTYNYVTTRAVGKIAKAHLKNRGRVDEQLRTLLSRRNIYDLAFPAAVLYAGRIEGELSLPKYELYRAMLSRMSFPEHASEDFQRLLTSETKILDAISQIEDDEVRRVLMTMLVLMTTCDGDVSEVEQLFLIKAAEHLDTSLDLEEVARKARDHQVVVERNVKRMARVAGKATGGVIEAAGQSAKGVRRVATATGGKVKGRVRTVFKRDKGPEVEATADDELGG